MLLTQWKCFTILLLGFFTLTAQGADRTDRLVEFQYQVNVPALKAEDLPLVIMVPLAPSNEQQSVLTRTIESSPTESIAGAEVRKEPAYGNEYWSWTIDKPRQKPTTVIFRYKVLRHFHTAGSWQAATKDDYNPGEKVPYQRFLEADKRVPIEGELISKLRKEIPKTATRPVQKAKAIYDYVVDNMEYKKVGTGWGNGDTYWACSQKYGNCTDFHALLTSMARAEGIPAKFAIGFSIPTDKPQGEIPGYHCWLELYLPQLAWMPVDASEAKKHPEQRELLFGNHPADRILFSIGRDLKLPGMQAEPLNYFIYPHVEKRGQAVQDMVTTRFSYRLLKKDETKSNG